MTSAYIRDLNSSIVAGHKSAPLTLRDKFESWFTSLPAPTRSRPFSMQEFEKALATTGRYISPILIELGWRRKRQWSSREHYHRFWIQPRL